ncbi:hypothetical protein ACOMHN_058139 [Nucella lapillus]
MKVVAAFLIPFLLALLVCGVPMFFLEMSVCQFSNLGPGKVWVVCPLFKGIGYGMVILTSLVSLYYNVIIAWALYYLAMSFRSPLPWASCGHSWNTPSCVPVGPHNQTGGPGHPLHNQTGGPGHPLDNLTSVVSFYDAANMTSVNVTESVTKAESSVVQFWTCVFILGGHILL